MKNIFITGVSGCVGHYVFDLLCQDPNYRLYLLVRNLNKLKFDPNAFSKVTIINDDLKNIEKHSKIINQMDNVIHLAADWGGHEGNLDYSLALFNLLDPAKCKKVIYFSTASILGPDGKLNAAAEKLGTNYIRSKYQFYKKLPELRIYPNVITLFPTWILGGGANHPYSHASQGILELRKWLWLIRFFTVDASFHFIHAKDLAAIVKYILENEVKEKEFIVGNAPVTASQFIREVCDFFNVRVYCQITISVPLVKFLALITGRKLHPWDIYSFNRRHFIYKTVNTLSFGINSSLQTVRDVLTFCN